MNRSPLLRGADVRLVVADMDGTLLDSSGRVPDRTRALLDRLAERGIAFAPASGRQYATLADLFPDGGTEAFIAENGTVVVRGSEIVSTSPLPEGTVDDVVAAVRGLAERGGDLGAVVCCPTVAYVERSDEPFVAEARRYYHSLEVVDDLTQVPDRPVKIAVYDFREVADRTGPAAGESTADVLEGFSDRVRVVVSGHHWVDLMAYGVDKGTAVRALQRDLGVTAEQTVAFGDYLNDLEMLDAAGWSFAMADGHPDVRARARYEAPPNADNGVAEVLQGLIET